MVNEKRRLKWTKCAALGWSARLDKQLHQLGRCSFRDQTLSVQDRHSRTVQKRQSSFHSPGSYVVFHYVVLSRIPPLVCVIRCGSAKVFDGIKN